MTKLNINKENWHFITSNTSNEAWKQTTNQNRSQSAEALTEEMANYSNLTKEVQFTEKFRPGEKPKLPATFLMFFKQYFC